MDMMDLSTEGMKTRILQQEAVANNLANVNTAGFKRDIIFSEELDAAESNAENVADGEADSGNGVCQVTVFEQGSLRETRQQLDLALEGEGFFVIRTPEGDRYTRNGHFHLDGEGMLVLEDGMVLMGERGPILLDSVPQVNENGEIVRNGAVADRIRVVAFQEPYPLKKLGNSLFAAAEGMEPAQAETARVRQGFLEESNVNPVEEMVRMMVLFRYFEADQKVIKTQDEILNKSANEIGRVV